jgi:hypothetical protein
MAEKTIGTVYVPVVERVTCEYEWDLCQSDLDRAGVKTIEEFVAKVRTGEVCIWDLDYTDIDTCDTEIDADYPDDATARCHVTGNFFPTN